MTLILRNADIHGSNKNQIFHKSYLAGLKNLRLSALLASALFVFQKINRTLMRLILRNADIHGLKNQRLSALFTSALSACQSKENKLWNYCIKN